MQKKNCAKWICRFQILVLLALLTACDTNKSSVIEQAKENKNPVAKENKNQVANTPIAVAANKIAPHQAIDPVAALEWVNLEREINALNFPEAQTALDELKDLDELKALLASDNINDTELIEFIRNALISLQSINTMIVNSEIWIKKAEEAIDSLKNEKHLATWRTLRTNLDKEMRKINSDLEDLGKLQISSFGASVYNKITYVNANKPGKKTVSDLRDNFDRISSNVKRALQKFHDFANNQKPPERIPTIFDELRDAVGGANVYDNNMKRSIPFVLKNLNDALDQKEGLDLPEKIQQAHDYTKALYNLLNYARRIWYSKISSIYNSDKEMHEANWEIIKHKKDMNDCQKDMSSDSLCRGIVKNYTSVLSSLKKDATEKKKKAVKEAEKALDKLKNYWNVMEAAKNTLNQGTSEQELYNIQAAQKAIKPLEDEFISGHFNFYDRVTEKLQAILDFDEHKDK